MGPSALSIHGALVEAGCKVTFHTGTPVPYIQPNTGQGVDVKDFAAVFKVPGQLTLGKRGNLKGTETMT